MYWSTDVIYLIHLFIFKEELFAFYVMLSVLCNIAVCACKQSTKSVPNRVNFSIENILNASFVVITLFPLYSYIIMSIYWLLYTSYSLIMDQSKQTGAGWPIWADCAFWKASKKAKKENKTKNRLFRKWIKTGIAAM